MNILNGLRLVNRSATINVAEYSLATAVAAGAAVSVLSISDAIEGKDDLKSRQLLLNISFKVRKLAFAAQRKEQIHALALSEAETDVLDMVLTGAKTLVMGGLSTMGTWFISTIMTGVSSVVVPAFEFLTFALGTAVRAVLFNPWVLGTLAAATASYMLYRKFVDKVDEPPEDKTRKVYIPVQPGDQVAPSSQAHAPSVSSDASSKQGFEPAQEIKQSASASPAAGGSPLVQGAVRKGTVNGFQVFTVPAASTSTAAPTVVMDSKGKKRDKIPAGILTNNPGDIEFRNQPGASQWVTASGKVSRFAKFATQEEGLYQIGRQLQLYDSRGTNTISKMINKYAPRSENNTSEYISGVVQQSGYAADKPVDMTDVSLVSALIRAIVKAEVGATPYTQAQYEEAAKRSIAFRGNKYQDTNFGLQIPTYGRISSPYGQRVDPVTGKFSRMHKGIDIAAPKGTPVFAASDGKAKVSPNTSGGYGNLLDILGDPYNTRYGHLSEFEVDDGARISRGQLVARVGNTGRSTGNHVHFEVLDHKGEAIDPATVMSLPNNTEIEKAQVVALPTSSELAVVRRNGKLIRLDK